MKGRMQGLIISALIRIVAAATVAKGVVAAALSSPVANLRHSETVGSYPWLLSLRIL